MWKIYKYILKLFVRTLFTFTLCNERKANYNYCDIIANIRIKDKVVRRRHQWKKAMVVVEVVRVGGCGKTKKWNQRNKMNCLCRPSRTISVRIVLLDETDFLHEIKVKTIFYFFYFLNVTHTLHFIIVLYH